MPRLLSLTSVPISLGWKPTIRQPIFVDPQAEHAQVTRLIFTLRPEVVGLRGIHQLHQWEARCRGAMENRDGGFRANQGGQSNLVTLPNRVFAQILEDLTDPG